MHGETKVSLAYIHVFHMHIRKTPMVLHFSAFHFNKNYNVYKMLNMTLHAGLANPTCLQSFMIWYCSVCVLRCLNSEKEKMKNLVPMGE